MAFVYQGQHLGISSGESFFPLSPLAAQAQGPLYVYDLDDVLNRADIYRKGFGLGHLHYALKANSNPILLRALASAGVGADVVSLGELEAAVRAGMATSKIVFSGVGKSVAEIERAMALDIKQINIESLPELKRVAQLAKARKRRVRVGLRINPDIDVKTHPYITTGLKQNKFGLDMAQFPEFIEMVRAHPDELQFTGLAYHLGSQILDVQPLIEAAEKAKELLLYLRQEGWSLQTLDIGGGLGIEYERDSRADDEKRISTYAAQISRLLGDLNCEIHCEPGRILVARAGALLGEVQYIKRTPHRNFTILNTGMNHLLRPALYQAYHRIQPLELQPNRQEFTSDVVGPICESADVLGTDRRMQLMEPGEWLAIMDTGAYGYSMASTYNSRPLPQEFVVSRGRVITS